MTVIVGLIGWPAALFCSAMASWALCRIAFVRTHPKTGRRLWGDSLGWPQWVTLLIWSAAAVALFAALGAISPLSGGLYAGIATVIVLALGRAWTPKGRSELRGHLTLAPAEAARESLWAWGRLAGWARGFRGGGGSGAAQGEIPLEAVADYAASRAIPSLMEDAALGAPAEPAAIAQAGIPVPVPWAQLAAYIRDREPSDDTELRMFHDGDAAGALAVADARHAYAETCLNAVRLSPAYVAGELEAADSMAEHASMLTQVGRRFTVIYGALKEWISGHGPLPNKGDFLTGD